MRQLTGLEHFFTHHSGTIKAEPVAEFMQKQFNGSHLVVYAEPLSEQKTVIATLALNSEMNAYDAYAQRLEMIFMGEVTNESIPLTYTINGLDLSFYGRCSVLSKVCGVDLYFSNYKRVEGSVARQKITISIKELVKELKKLQKDSNS